MSKDDSDSETLKPLVGDENGGLALHQDGEHTCITPFQAAHNGQPIDVTRAFVPRGDGRFERLDRSGGSLHGPAQVATEAYRESWNRTFLSRGGDA